MFMKSSDALRFSKLLECPLSFSFSLFFLFLFSCFSLASIVSLLSICLSSDSFLPSSSSSCVFLLRFFYLFIFASFSISLFLFLLHCSPSVWLGFPFIPIQLSISCLCFCHHRFVTSRLCSDACLTATVSVVARSSRLCSGALRPLRLLFGCSPAGTFLASPPSLLVSPFWVLSTAIPLLSGGTCFSIFPVWRLSIWPVRPSLSFRPSLTISPSFHLYWSPLIQPLLGCWLSGRRRFGHFDDCSAIPAVVRPFRPPPFRPSSFVCRDASLGL